MIRGPIIGCMRGIRSERRLWEEVYFDLAYRWFCLLDLTDLISDQSTCSENSLLSDASIACRPARGRFHGSDLFRRLKYVLHHADGAVSFENVKGFAPAFI